jgi:hypothetical protein
VDDHRALDGEAERVLGRERECLAAGVDHRGDGDAADGVGHLRRSKCSTNAELLSVGGQDALKSAASTAQAAGLAYRDQIYGTTSRQLECIERAYHGNY